MDIDGNSDAYGNNLVDVNTNSPSNCDIDGHTNGKAYIYTDYVTHHHMDAFADTHTNI
jgi:hypothetical protein